MYCYTFMDSPIGRLTLVAAAGRLSRIAFPEERHPWTLPAGACRADEPFSGIIGQLNAYFCGELRRFELPIDAVGTPFQRLVWAELQRIPYGRTVSYGELAERIGRPLATRAVGAANGRNPLPIVVPCHRVIGSDGRLTGFGGGLGTKAALLALERGVPHWAEMWRPVA